MDQHRSQTRFQDARNNVRLTIYTVLHLINLRIFEEGGGPDALRLLVGKLPGSSTGPAAQSTAQLSLPLSSHYARLLSNLAVQRGFDGYLLNFEVPLQGSVEQTRALAAWITILQNTLKVKVGPHAEVIWYDSVVTSGNLAWQDRLDSLNLPFFLSSTGFFSNYTVRLQYHPRELNLISFAVAKQLSQRNRTILHQPRSHLNGKPRTLFYLHRQEISQRHLRRRRCLGTRVTRKWWFCMLQSHRPHQPRITRSQRRSLWASMDLGKRTR